jgi:hypothetical protein
MSSSRVPHFISDSLPNNPLSVHHELTLKPAREILEEWRNIVLQEARRCPFCWLRFYNCYCNYLKTKAAQYQIMISQHSSPLSSLPISVPSITVTIYYHYHEIGRSANTMHILEILCPSLCQNLILGDIDQETKLLQRIIQSQDEERLGNTSRKIAVLYPSTDSIIIPVWLQPHFPTDPSVSSEAREETKRTIATTQTIELIVLDGTYGQATRLVTLLFILSFDCLLVVIVESSSEDD